MRLEELFGRAADLYADHIAVIDDREALTYERIRSRAAALTAHLRELGVGAGDIVTVTLERGADIIVAFLGVLGAGAAYLPVDVMTPHDRVAGLIRRSGSGYIIADRPLPGLGTGRDRVPGLVGSHTWCGATRFGVRLADHGSPIAYVIYTSGSTGEPKGVMVTHENVRRLFTATAAAVRPGPDDVWIMCHSPAFDFSVWEMWGALLHGGSLVVPSDVTVRDPARLWRTVTSRGVTVLNQTPSAAARLVSQLEPPVQDAVRLLVLGGEALDAVILQLWFDRNPAPGRVLNMYGITEVTVHVTTHEVLRAECDEAGPSCIGVPLADLAVRVVGADGAPVPTGTAGELHVAGAGVAVGYLGDPEQTAARFLDDLSAPGGRWYRTGDVVRQRDDGELEYIARNDDQIKINGYRIEPGEVAAHLRKRADVQDAAVIAANVSGNNPELCAFVVPAGGATVHIADLRRDLRGSLPPHLVPARVTVLRRMPLTTNGKVDTAALEVSLYEVQTHEYALGDVERAVAEVFVQIVGEVGPLGGESDFFELGGTSMQAVRLMDALTERTGKSLALRELFRDPTVRGIARALNVAGDVA